MPAPTRASAPLATVRALLAGAALLAGTALPSHAQDAPDTEDTALAIPRLRPGGATTLPRPLDAATAARLRAAFHDPSAPIDRLDDNPLLGHLLAERLLTAPHPPLDALHDWLGRFADLPDATTIHALLLARLPRNGPQPPAPALANVALPPPGDDIESGAATLRRNPALDRPVLQRNIRDALRAGNTGRAQALVARANLPNDAAAQLRAEIARALFGLGRDHEALALAEAANRQARGAVALAPWIGGLAAWRLDRPELARTWFEAAWRTPSAGSSRRAAAAFWAARATLAARGTRGPWLQRAAHEPRTFYGLLARRMLGQPTLATTPTTTLAEADIDAVAATPRGERAFALIQIGQPARAAAELHVLWAETRDRQGMARAIGHVARAANLAELAAQIDLVLAPTSARLPAARLRPSGGFTVDPALVYALARLESNFDPTAVSPAGARGLMQLMPQTARYVLAGTTGSDQAPDLSRLHDPATNLDVGQRYLLRLGAYDSIGSDLVRLLAAYNAGVGNYLRWNEQMGPQDDPLLFIEAIPGAETRAYIPRALAYTWLYAAQLNLPSPSLDELAAGMWPRLQAHRPNARPLARPWREAAVRLH